MQVTLKLLYIARDRKKNVEKRERKTKNQKKPNNNNIFLLLLFYLERFIYCSKTYLEKLNLYCYICITVVFAWKVIGNAVTKHRRP